jgi:hypothetical protein
MPETPKNRELGEARGLLRDLPAGGGGDEETSARSRRQRRLRRQERAVRDDRGRRTGLCFVVPVPINIPTSSDHFEKS